ncbi:hypothetical protein [Candidatus Chloroploca sp. Khr17]|uniref:hypothetical protein n=1 Tax=Candidatus Chloroploca sp. Khr17 TaxID=2496869 RepID=UPI00101CBC3C|nr:hypothetical protein [Candidatus Chloroploca sp. Khr17]
MAGRTTTAMDPGQILTDAGADTFRGELLSAHAVRCQNFWLATATVYHDGAAEIAIWCSLNPAHGRWDAEIYYFSFEQAIRALREYEETGNIPEGE